MGLDPLTPPNTAAAVAERIESGASPNELPDLRDLVQAAPELKRFYIASAVRCLTAQRRHFDFNSKQMLFTPDYDTRMRAVSFLACLAGDTPGPSWPYLRSCGNSPGPTFQEALEASAALRSQIRKALDKAEKRAAKGQDI